MVDFSYEIINQIKAAKDDCQVKSIIKNSTKNLHHRNSNGFSAKRRFMMNMVMTLRYTKAEGLNSRASENVSIAIEVFENLRKHVYGYLF